MLFDVVLRSGLRFVAIWFGVGLAVLWVLPAFLMDNSPILKASGYCMFLSR